MKGKFFKNTAVLMSGTALSQALLVVAAPFLTRMYSPGDFGFYGVFLSFVSIITVVSNAGYEMAIVIPRKEDDSKALLVISIIFALIFSSLVFLGALFFDDILSSKFGLRGENSLPFIVFGSVFAAGFFQAVNYWCIREENFKPIASMKVLRAITTVIPQIFLGILGFGFLGLGIGHVIGQIAGSIGLYFIIFKKTLNKLCLVFDFKEITKNAKEYSMFPKYRVPQALINSLSQYAPSLLLAYFFDAKIAGYYFLTVRVLQLPLSLVGQAFKQTFLGKISQTNKDHKGTYSVLIKTTIVLAGIALIPTFTVVVWGPSIFALIFGEEWRVSGEYSRWIAIWFFFGFINAPSFTVIQVYLMQGLLLVWEVMMLSRILVFFFPILCRDPNMGVMFFSILGAVFNAILILLAILTSYKKRSENILDKDVQLT